MSQPLFSVITPTFNSGAKLASTVSSVLSQEAGLYEYLILDGGSTDSTVPYLRSLGSSVRWFSEPDSGIYEAMNKGVRLSTGKLLYFLGAGDVLRPQVLRAVADQIPVVSGLHFLYGDVNWPAFLGIYGGAFDAARLSKENISHQAIFYERGIFDLLGGFDERYKVCADYAMNIRCFNHPQICKTHLDLVIADFEGGGVSVSKEGLFYDELAFLVWRHLGPTAGIRAFYYHSKSFRWARALNFHMRQPLRTLPGRLLQLARRFVS